MTAVTRVDVEDANDPRLADYAGLRDRHHRERYEAERGIFVAEGILTIKALLRSPYRARSLLVTDARIRELTDDLDNVRVPVYVAPLDVMRQTVGFDIHRGAVAAADRLPLPEPAALLRSARTVAVLEGVNDHENLGALFRNAAAFGLDAVLLDPTCADPLYRRSVRVSLGHVLHVPFTRISDIGPLTAAGFTTVALTPSADAGIIDDLAADPPPKTAFLLGAEGPGLSPATLAAADRRVRIPMAAGVDSLNLATAAAIAFHRIFR